MDFLVCGGLLSVLCESKSVLSSARIHEERPLIIRLQNLQRIVAVRNLRRPATSLLTPTGRAQFALIPLTPLRHPMGAQYITYATIKQHLDVHICVV